MAASSSRSEIIPRNPPESLQRVPSASAHEHSHSVRHSGAPETAVSFLASATGVEISESNFENYNPQASVTVNINHSEPGRRRYSQDVVESIRLVDHTIAPTGTHPSSTSTQRLNQGNAIPTVQEERIASSLVDIVVNQEPRESPEIYRAQLGKSGVRGHPLWIPQPNSHLPKEYRCGGTRIGDVGIFTPEGGFDFLFNILRPASDPINPPDLPSNFSPLDPPLKYMDIRKFQEFGEGNYLSSSSVSRVQGSTSQHTEAIFESSAAEGAILMMPDGASMEELSNLPIFSKYIKKNAKMFYDYANNTRGRNVGNGELHLVYGSRKSTSWGIATFSNSTKQSKLRLQFASSQQNGRNGNVISWEHILHSGVADVKVGPNTEENMDLPGAEGGHMLPNQCLFASTISMRLSDRRWDKLNTKKSVKIRSPHLKTDASDHSSRPTGSSNVNNSSISESGGGPETSSDSAAPQPSETTRLSLCDSSSQSDSSDDEEGVQIIGDTPIYAGAPYPSEILTKYLMHAAPTAEMALSSDKDFAGLKDWDADASSLIEHVCSLNHIREEDGVAFFEPKAYVNAAHAEDLDKIIQSLASGHFSVRQYLFGPSDDQPGYTIHTTAEGSGIIVFAGLPSPHRPFTLDEIIKSVDNSSTSLTQIYEEREAISLNELRDNVSTQPESLTAIYDLARKLLSRYAALSQQDDLDEAIWLFEHALSATAPATFLHLEILLDLSTSLYMRFQRTDQTADQDRLRECITAYRNLDVDALLALAASQLSKNELAPFNHRIPQNVAYHQQYMGQMMAKRAHEMQQVQSQTQAQAHVQAQAQVAQEQVQSFRPTAQQMDLVVQLSGLSVAQLAASGVDEKTITFIESNRSTLQRQLADQKVFQAKMKGQAMLSQDPNGGPAGPRPPAANQPGPFGMEQDPIGWLWRERVRVEQQRQQARAAQQLQQGQPGQIQPGQQQQAGQLMANHTMNMVGRMMSDSIANQSHLMGQPGNPSQPIQDAEMFIRKAKSDFMRGLNMRLVDVPAEQRIEYNKLLEAANRVISHAEQNLSLVHIIFSNNKMHDQMKKLIANICLVQSQRNVLSGSGNPRYILTYEHLNGIMVESQRIMELFSVQLTAARARSQQSPQQLQQQQQQDQIIQQQQHFPQPHQTPQHLIAVLSSSDGLSNLNIPAAAEPSAQRESSRVPNFDEDTDLSYVTLLESSPVPNFDEDTDFSYYPLPKAPTPALSSSNSSSNSSTGYPLTSTRSRYLYRLGSWKDFDSGEAPYYPSNERKRDSPMPPSDQEWVFD